MECDTSNGQQLDGTADGVSVDVNPTRAAGPLTVYMLDPFCCVPYYNSYLVRGLSEHGVDVRLGSVGYFYDPEYFKRLDIRREVGLTEVVSRMGIPWARVRRPLRVLELLANLLAYALRFTISRPDIIHVQYLALADRGLGLELWFLSLANKLGIPLVYTVHNVLPQSTGNRYKALYAKIYDRADVLLCHTEAAKADLIHQFELAPNKIEIIPHGPLFGDIGRESQEASRAALDIPEDRVMVLCHGGIKPYKGIEFLLDAWALLEREYPQALLLIAGPGEVGYLTTIRERVQTLGLTGSVRLDFGFAPAEELPRFFQAADILVYPYKEITASGALMTGMNFARPIVATDLPGFQEMLEADRNALLVPYGDAPAMASALGELVVNPEERVRLGRGVSETLAADESIGWKNVAAQTLVQYESLLRRQAGG